MYPARKASSIRHDGGFLVDEAVHGVNNARQVDIAISREIARLREREKIVVEDFGSCRSLYIWRCEVPPQCVEGRLHVGIDCHIAFESIENFRSRIYVDQLFSNAQHGLVRGGDTVQSGTDRDPEVASFNGGQLDSRTG